MNCEDVAEMLPDYLAGELDDEQMHLVTQHVIACSDCAHELERLKAERAFLLQELQPVNPPPTLRRTLDNALGVPVRLTGARRPSLGVLVRIAALVVCTVGIGLLVMLFMPVGKEEQVPLAPVSPEAGAQVEELLAEISHLAAKVGILTSRPVLWDDQGGRFPRLSPTASRSQEHLVQQDREALAALELAAARLREAADDAEGSRARREFVLAYLADTMAFERNQP